MNDLKWSDSSMKILFSTVLYGINILTQVFNTVISKENVFESSSMASDKRSSRHCGK